MNILRRLFRYFRPYLWQLILYIFFGLVIIAFAMVNPYLMKILFDNVLLQTPFTGIEGIVLEGIPLLVCIGAGLLIIAVIRQGLAYWRSYMIESVSQSVLNTMRSDLFRKMLHQSQSFMRQQNTGDIMTTINGDPEMVKNFFVGTIPQVFESTVGFIFASVVMASFNPYLLISAYIMTPIIMWLTKRANKVMRQVYTKLRENTAEVSKCAQENINGIRVVKAFSSEELEKEKFDRANKEYLHTQYFYLKQWRNYYVPLILASIIPNILLNVIGVILVFGDKLTIGTFIAMGGYLGYMTTFFSNLPNWITQIQQSNTSGEKILNFLERGTTIASIPNAQVLKNPIGSTAFEHVSFFYDKKAILQDITVDIPKGKKLGIMGATGSGKTMMVNLLMRFYDPDKGTITFDGINEKQLDLDQLRENFSIVMQDVFLFSETVAKNIAFGNPDATQEQIETAAKIAQAHDFISNLPDGYNTVIGERGMGLSGGQKQRISIARALLKSSPILILDDASSALDMETDQALQKAIEQNLNDKTVITITHRVSSVKHCDEILYLEHGKIIERGTHDELVALGGRYYEIYAAQYNVARTA